MKDPNPFDALGLDPSLPTEEITRILRHRVESASVEEREKIARLWREITMHDEKRLRYALFAHPRARAWEPDSIEELKKAVAPIIVRISSGALDAPDEFPAASPAPPRRPLFES